MAEAFLISADDKKKLSRLLRENNRAPKSNPVTHSERNRKYERSPELYVASPPESTEIPARAADVPGQLECEIFRLTGDIDTGEVTIIPMYDTDEVTPATQMVYNIYDRPIPSWTTPNRTYIQVERSKDGTWLCEAPTPALIYFQLAEDKFLATDPVEAVILTFNGTDWVDSGIDIFLHDSYYPAPGFFTGVNGYDRGWAEFRTAKDPGDPADRDHYQIVWMSGPCHVIEFTLTGTRNTAGTAESLAATRDYYYLYGHDVSPTTVYFNTGYFPNTFVGAKGIALWNDREIRYQVIYCQEPYDYGIPFYNDSGGTIPAYAAMVLTGAFDANGYPKVTQASTAGFKQVGLVNGPNTVASTAIGLGSWLEHGRLTPYGRVLYNSGSGTPAVGEEWGMKSGQWDLVKNRPGFYIIGNPDTTNHHVLAIQTPVRGLIGKLTGTVGAGASGTLNIWFGAGGSEAVSSEGWTLAVTNRTGLSLTAAKWCSAVWRNGNWYVEPWECP
jgi:hypothetical protein